MSEAATDTLYLCSRCDEHKPAAEMHRQKEGGERRITRWCKSCYNARAKERYHTDPLRRAKQIIHSLNSQKRHGAQRVDVDAAVALMLGATECHYCAQPNDGSVIFALDHKTPIALGGQNVIENLAPCCEPCNRAKHDMAEEDYRQWLRGVVNRNYIYF